MTDVSDEYWSIVVPSASAVDIDMGRVPLNSSRDTVVTAFLTNTGPCEIRIDAIQFAGADASMYSLISDFPPFVLPEGSSRAVEFRFSPSSVGAKTAVIIIHTQVDTLSQVIRGEGVAMEGAATLAVDTIRARIGEMVDIPIVLREEQNLVSTGATAFEAELCFDASILVPIGSTPLGTVHNGERRILLSQIPVLPDDSGVLARYAFVATLGSAESTALRLENPSAHGGSVMVTGVPGYLLLTDICEEGGVRFFEQTGVASLRQNHPNPFNSTTVIECHLIEHGPTRLSVYDMLGRTVAVLVNGSVEPGSYVFRFDGTSLPSGTYFTLLQTPTMRMVRLMDIVK